MLCLFKLFTFIYLFIIRSIQVKTKYGGQKHELVGKVHTTPTTANLKQYNTAMRL